MKSIIALLIVLFALSIALAACSNGDGGGGVTLAPNAPQNVNAVQGAQKITISWAPVAGVASYNIYWSNTAGVTKAIGTKVTNAASPYLHSHLSPGNYYYVVTAVDSNGESAESLQTSMPVNLISFVTSTTGNANLGSWPDAVTAGSVTGLAAGDAICQARALASGLTGTFKAWLSDSSNDAYCRIHNLNGTKTTTCGLPVLPVAAGPWIRTDGTPFAPTIDKMTTSASHFVYTPLNYDEFGLIFPTYSRTFTSTAWDGAFSGGTACADWTDGASTANLANGGLVYATIYAWGSGNAAACNYVIPLICMQTGTGEPLPPIASTGKKTFITSTTHTGNLGGLAGADAICQTRANAAGLANAAKYKAWLSDGTHDAVSRLSSNGPWYRIDGIKVASDKIDLTDGTLFSTISQDELGEYTNQAVWSGTNSNGMKAATTCNDWTDGTGGYQGLIGLAYLSEAHWSNNGSFLCSSSLQLYCFEDQ